MLDVVVLLDMFQQHALKPHGSLPRHCRSLELLARILEILLSGDRAISHVDELEACVDEHATLFVALYEHCAKPKFHMLFHVGNAVGSSVANQLQNNLAVRAASQDLKSIEEGVFEPTALASPLVDLHWAVDLLAPVLAGVQLVQRSRKMYTSRGSVFCGDVLWSQCLNVVYQVKACLVAVDDEGQKHFLFHVTEHKRVNGNRFNEAGTPGLIFFEDGLVPVPYSVSLARQIVIYTGTMLGEV
ncbi:unnamed protein product [Symbiodinium sp. KB8]|nr:unnamed protein product [Symbiodinium sp. KB8]